MPQLFKKLAKIGEGPRLKDKLVLQRGHASAETRLSRGTMVPCQSSLKQACCFALILHF